MPAALQASSIEIGKKLEKHYRDVQDIEFTIQHGKLWMLQTRNAKRTGFAAVRIAVDLVDEGLITKEDASQPKRIPPDDLNQLLQPIFDPAAKKTAVDGRPAAGQGHQRRPRRRHRARSFFHAADAEAMAQETTRTSQLILVRRETSPEDLRGMQAADGILTAFGGASSHAALVSRQMGKVCIVGCGELNIDYDAGTVTVGGKVLQGRRLHLRSTASPARSSPGQVATKPSEVVQVLDRQDAEAGGVEGLPAVRQADGRGPTSTASCSVRTNADKPDQAAEAIAFGAEGIGLCRTEHMFFDHIDEIREMILADDARRTARRRWPSCCRSSAPTSPASSGR